jgi:hypothetical protein
MRLKGRLETAGRWQDPPAGIRAIPVDAFNPSAGIDWQRSTSSAIDKTLGYR